MSVPARVDGSCSGLESALEYCEAKLLAVGNNAISQSTPYSVTVPLPELPSYSFPQGSALLVCGVLLGILLILHMIRQAWYIWGGEGAFAFPFDK